MKSSGSRSAAKSEAVIRELEAAGLKAGDSAELTRFLKAGLHERLLAARHFATAAGGPLAILDKCPAEQWR
jgi:hypothetical protein